MFNGTLEVGKEYELNNWEVYRCECMHSGDPWLDATAYLPNGHVIGCSFGGPFSVRGPAVGTLAELDVKPGDVVRHVAYHDNRDDVLQIPLIINASLCPCMGDWELFCSDSPSTFRIISRAEHTKPDTPTVFGELTDAEKGALLLAHHNGEYIQMQCHNGAWVNRHHPTWNINAAYRVKPKPAVETVTRHWCGSFGFSVGHHVYSTHRLTFDVKDGNPTNPRFEAINETDDC